MCGIIGLWRRKTQSQSIVPKLNKMLDIIEHRGPDDRGAWADERKGVGLGMVRLSIVDNSSHSIPYFNEDKSIALVFNGEIYNHKDLRREFKEEHIFSSDSDTETLIHAYEEWGMDMLLKLNGMFSIAIYDIRKEKVFLARDIAGEKPLYYAENGHDFYFASEVKSILPFISPEINDDCLAYRAFEICCDRETFFKGVYSLLPGEFVEIKRESTRNVKYWKMEDQRIELPDDEDTIVDMLTELVVDCVNVRTQNSVHSFTCLLSGGVDSSLLACIAKPDYLFTCTYDLGKAFDELEYAQAVADSIGKELIIIRPTKKDFENYREEIIWHLDYPCTWTSFNEYCVFKEVAKVSRITLTGEGVDELFGGYHRYHLLNHDQQIYQLDAMENYSYLIDKYYGSSAERYARIINRSDNVHDTEIKEYLKGCTEDAFEKFGDVVTAMGIVDYHTSMQALLQMADRMNMAFSIENRAPFLDPRLIQFAYSLPGHLKIKNGITKYVFKKVASRFVPDKIINRKDKRGFLAPVNIWFGFNEEGKKYDRSVYKEMVYKDWLNVFFEKKRHLV